jgi:DNA-binding IclR family transcriptional regulator
VGRPSSAEAIAVQAGVSAAETLRCLVELHARGLARRVESGWQVALADPMLDEQAGP